VDQRLLNGLELLAWHMRSDADPWWIIGSAALVISGIEGVTPCDIDVISTKRTLDRLLNSAGSVQALPKPDERFRSDPFGRIVGEGALDIEVQGDLEVCVDGNWQRLEIVTRQAIHVGNVRVFLPSLTEQSTISALFGRPKDLVKAALIKAKL
jgi:hypothetical protein